MNPLFRKPVKKIAVSPSPFFKTDGYLYHGTTPRDLESILEGGAVEGPSFWGVKDIADMYDAGAMLRLPVNRFNQSLLIPDMNMMRDPYFLDDSEGEYDPKKLNALNRAWKASKKTWKDSLKIWGAVIYDENLPVTQADVLGEQPIVSSKIADDANIGTVKNIIAEMMGVLSGGLPQPEVKIVNQTNRMLGQNVWQWGRRSDGQTFGADNTTMEIQKRVLTDETTLRRIIAHELCHHEVSLLVAKPKLLELGFETYKRFGNILGPDGHGKEWKAVASRFNAKYGADFVTRTSDQDFVYGTTDDKELFILLNNYVYGRHKQRLGWQWAVTLSPKAKEFLNSLDWESGEYKLVKSTDHNLTRGRAKIRQWGGWNLSRTPEQEAAIQKLWAEAPATKVAAEEDDYQADYNKVREDRVKTYAKFIDLADEQRGAPESAMLKIQHDPLGAGVYSFAVEHTGDLTHRMNERTSIIWGNFGYDSVKNKTEKVLRYLEQGYGFEREMQGNLKNNYEALKDEKLKGISYEDALAKFKAKGLAYANAHAALTVYNRPQELCRDAAVALGKWEFDKTRAIMNTIMSLLNEGPEAWVAQASQGANIDKTAKTGPHKASTAMVVLPSGAAAKMMEAAMQIPDEELGTDGREDEPHITIKYGVKDDVELLKNTVAGVKPFNVTLGKTHVFEVSESSNGQAPIVVEVHGPELAELHDTVNRIMGTRPDDFEYKPHVTLAYVRADIAMKYKGLDWCEGISFQVNSVTLSRKGGSKTPVEFGKQASHKTPPMSDTHYRDPELGEETNAYANLPQKVDGLTEFPALESLSPDLFKTGAQNFKPMLFDNWADANPMYQPDDFNEAEWRYDENVAHFSTLDFPVTVYRAIEIEAGTQVDLDNAGTYWSWVENSAQAYFGEGSIWGPGGKKIKEPLIVMLKAQILRSTDVDWDATLLANMLNEEENEINVKSGAQLRLLGIDYDGKGYKKQQSKNITAKFAYGDASTMTTRVGEKGVGGQDFPDLEEEPMFADEKTANATGLTPTEAEQVQELKDMGVAGTSGRSSPKLERVPLFPEDNKEEKKTARVAENPFPIPTYLYHGTSKENLDAILKDGLRIEFNESNIEWSKAIYLACDETTAASYAAHKGVKPENWVLLQITVNRLHKDLLRPDDYDFRDVWEYYGGDIEPWVKEEYGSNWALVPWEVSLKYSCQVAYLGDIPANAIKVIPTPKIGSSLKTADAESYFTGMDEAARSIIGEFEQHINNPKYRQKWQVVPAARLKKIWNDYAKTGMVRDEKGMGDIAWTVQYNIWKIHANTILCGHTEQSPIQFAENVMGENLEEKYGRDVFQDDHAFFDDDKGAWRLSDYALEPLINASGKLENAKTAEQQLQAVDFILNIVHARSDLASWFVQGGTSTLNSLAGYEKHKEGSAFPSFGAWVKKNGGIAKLLSSYDVDTAETYGYGLEEPENPAAVKRYEKELHKRALADFQDRYEELIAHYQSWEFPMDVFRCISLPKNPNPPQQHLFPGTPQANFQQALEAIQYKGVGIYWSWDENSAECHWGTGGASVTLHGIINKDNVDWEGTIYANMFPTLGQEEKEVRLIEGTRFELEGIQYDEKSGWSEPPVRTVTAAAEKKPRYYYHATKAENLNSIAKHGLKPSENPQWGGDLGATSYGKVFFASNPRTAMYYAMIVFHDTLEAYQHASVPICLRVRVPENVPVVTGTPTDKTYDKSVPVAPGEEFGEAWATQVIPPENIEVFWHQWRPLAAGGWDEMEVRYREPEDWEIEQSAEQGEVEVNGYYEDWEGDIIGDTVSETVDDIEQSVMPKVAKSQTVGEVYLLHFNIEPGENVPSSREDATTNKFHARHYLGWAENAQERIEQHYKATSGVKLIEAIHSKGITFTVAKVWTGVDRNFERRLKNQGGLGRHCPICRELGIDRDTLRKKKLKELVPATSEAGPDFVEKSSATHTREDAKTIKTLLQGMDLRLNLSGSVSRKGVSEHDLDFHVTPGPSFSYPQFHNALKADGFEFCGNNWNVFRNRQPEAGYDLFQYTKEEPKMKVDFFFKRNSVAEENFLAGVKSAGFKTAYLPSEMQWFKDYLTMNDTQKAVDLAYKWPGDFVEYVTDTEDAGKLPQGDDPEDVQEEILNTDFSQFSEDVMRGWMEHQIDYLMANNPADAPSWATLSYEGLVKNQWLIHFTDDAWSIANNGFKYGTDDMDRAALSTWFTEASKQGGGFNFAFLLGDFMRYSGARGGNPKYGKEAVIFRASGIKVWHSGDDEPQIIFRGSEARDIVPIQHPDNWVLPENAKDRPIYQNEDLSAVTSWVVNNWAQYQQALRGYFDDYVSKNRQPKPKQQPQAQEPELEPATASKTAAEPWEMRQDEYAGRWNEQETEEQSGVRHQKNQEWEQNALSALSLGKITPDQAKERGVYEAKNFKPLPQTPLYHVTTAKSKVESEGLKTRYELGQSYGKGLGGGTSMSISFTDDYTIAQGIYDNLLIARKVAAGEMSLDEMIDTATRGEGANRPWIDDILKSLGGGNAKDKINVELDAIKRGVAFEHGLGRPPDDEAILPQYRKPGPWRPTPWSQHWKGGDGEEKYTYWERDLTPKEKQERVFEFFKKWSFWREQAGGGLDPLYFMSDPSGLAQVPESEIAIMQFKAVPGAMGTIESALGEWRVYTGAAVQLVGKADAAHAASLVRTSSDFAKFAFLIEVPESSRAHFWDEPPAHNLEFWAFKGRPAALPNEKVYFTFDKVPVAETTILKIERPGESKCELSGKYEQHWKLYWEPAKFTKYAGHTAPTLYHGTCLENAQAILKNGWKPNQVSQGGNMGQPQYLYLTNFPENAQWFANEKGCDTILEVRNVPSSSLIVDPEDGTEDTVENELNFSEKAFPGTVALTKSLDKSHFRIYQTKTAAMPKKWYHGTSAKNAEKIMKDGYLRPDQETIYDIDIPRDGAVYIAEFDVANQYAIERSRNGVAGIVLEVAAPDISKLLPDEDDVYELLNDRGGELNAGGQKLSNRIKAIWLQKWNEENASEREHGADDVQFPHYKTFDDAWEKWSEIEYEGSSGLSEQMHDLVDYIVKRDPKLARAVIESAGKAAHMGPLKVVKQVKTAAPKSIWYHGTSLKNLQSIMSQGLVPEGTEKVWADDPEAGISAPSRQSYGGIYVTQNLMTATGAPDTEDKKARGGVVVVIMELQPNTMYLDEDSITGVLGGPIKHMSDNTYHVLIYYLAATQDGVPEEWQKEVKAMQDDYVRKCLAQWENKFAERKMPFHPDLKKKLEEMLPDVWLAAITRAASHVTDNYSFIRAWDQLFYGTPKEKQRPDMKSIIPSNGEAAFREAAEKVTRTLRLLARPNTEGSQTYNINTARVNEPIGFSGSNHIIAIVEVRDRQTPAQMILHWGTIPQDFWNQWNTKFGSKYELVDARKGEPKAQGATASKQAALTPKAQAAWEAIKASGQITIPYHGAGGAILSDGTKIHSHIIKSLRKAGLLEAGPGIHLWHDTGGTDKTPWTWEVVQKTAATFAPLYHGTSNKFDVFRTRRNQIPGGGMSLGAYFTENPEVAKKFMHGPNATLKKVSLELNNPLDLRGVSYSELPEALPWLNESAKMLCRQSHAGMYQVLEYLNKLHKLVPTLKKRGYDGIIFDDDVEGTTYVAFQPDQIEMLAAEDKITISQGGDGRITAKHVDGAATGTLEDREGLAKWFNWNALPAGDTGKYDKSFVLGNVSVKVTARRTGLGRALVGALLDAARAQGAEVCFLTAFSTVGLSAKELDAFYTNIGFQPYFKDVYVRKLAGVTKYAAMNRISQQDAVDRKMFGPVYHGTTEDRQEQIGNEGFKIYVGDAGSGDVQHGYEGREAYHDGIPAPVHHLGYGVYFTTAKSIAKTFAGGTTRGMKTYYLDVPNLETINFGAPKTMMKWWISQGYDPQLAKTNRVEATKKLTNNLKSKYDAVWYKGKGMFKLLDGDQICVFDANKVYEVDPNMSKPGDIGSKVKRKADGMRGVIKNIRPIPPDVAQQYHGGADKFYEIKWTKGGTDHNVYERDIDFVGGKTSSFSCVACESGECIEHDGKPKVAAEGFNDEGFWAGEGNAASGVLPICTTTHRICLAWRSPDVHIGDCWGTIGGAVKSGMSLAESAKAELKEETGFGGGVTMKPAYVFQSGSFSYHNFLGTVGSEFSFHPQSAHHWETTGLEWFTWEQIQQMIAEDSGSFHPGLISLFKSNGAEIERLAGVKAKGTTAAGDDGDMPNMLQVFPERPDVIETFRYMRPFERDALIEEASPKDISPAELKTNQKTVTRSTVEHFVTHPEEINKPQSNIGLSDTEQLLPLVLLTNDGYWLYDGNHRANAAMKLDMMLECKVVDLRDYEDGICRTASTATLPTYEQFVHESLNYNWESKKHTAPMSSLLAELEIPDEKTLQSEFEAMRAQLSAIKTPVTVYRKVYLEDGIKSLRLDRIGGSWSDDEAHAQVVHGPGAFKQENVWTLKASVSASSIDWHQTLWLRLTKAFGEKEREIRVRVGAPIRLLGYKPESGEWQGLTKTVTAGQTVSGEEVAQHILDNSIRYGDSRPFMTDLREAYQLMGVNPETGASTQWELKDVPVDLLTPGDDYSPAVAEQYADMDTPFPPIVMNSYPNGSVFSGTVLDGNHRAAAAKLRGDKTIEAYIPASSPKPPVKDDTDVDELYDALKTGKVAKQYGPVYHGSYREWSDKIQNDQYKIGKFFSSDPLVAQAYGSFVYECYLTINKPFVVDAKGESYSSIPTPKALKGWVAEGMDEVDTDNIADFASKHGYDGVIVKNVVELHHQVEADDYIVFKPNQIKMKGIIEPEISPYTANKYHKDELRRRSERGYAEDQPKVSRKLAARGEVGPVYHGTDKKFDKFDYRPGTRYILFKEFQVQSGGFFFTDDPEQAKEFGSNVMTCYLKMKKPFIKQEDQYNLTKKQIADLTYICEPCMSDGYSDMHGNSVKTIELGAFAIDVDEDGNWMNEVVKSNGLDWNILDNATAVARMKERGYDSTMVDEESGKYSYCVFSPEQIRIAPNQRGKAAAAPGRALKLYHVTTVDIAKKIKAHGFKPVDQGMWKNYYAPQGRDGIYFYDDLKYSEAYAAYAEGQLYTRNMSPDKSWSENKKTIPQMAIIEVQVPEGVAITTDQKEDGYFVSSADLDKVRIMGMHKYDYVPTQGRGIGEKFGTNVGQIVDSFDVLKYVRNLHEGYEDDGRITQYKEFELKEVPLDQIDAPWETSEELIGNYSVLTTPYPPIVLDHHNTVIDGTHRVGAAYDRGDKTIKAFVPYGDPESFPTEEEESENALRGLADVD